MRTALTQANAVAALGAIEGSENLILLDTNAQLRSVEDYGRLVVKTVNGVPIRLSSVAAIEEARVTRVLLHCLTANPQ